MSRSMAPLGTAVQNQRILFLAFFIHESYFVAFGVFNVDLVGAECCGFILVVDEIEVPFQ